MFDLARPAVEGVAWPPMPSPGDAMFWSLYYQLDQTQWWSKERLEASRNRQLEVLAHHALDHVPFYRQRLPDPARLADESVWQTIPVLSRAEVQEHADMLRAASVPPEHGKVSTARTSGSTGIAIEVAKPAILLAFMGAIMLRDIAWHQRNTNKTLAAIRVAANNPKAKQLPGVVGRGWGAATASLATRGRSHLLDVSVPLADQLRFLEQTQPAYILTYPSNLRALLALIAERGRQSKFSGLEHVKTMAEYVPDDLRQMCRDVLGVPIIDEYSAQEIGSIAIQCPETGHYHVNAETVRVEVLDDDGRPCRPGTVGRVVVTTLHNFAMPLIRYDIGDYAEVGEACPCGRGLPVLNRIAGRVRNLIRMPNGERRWPLPGDHRYREIAPIIQYQFVQTALDHFDVNLVVGRPLTDGEEQQFAAWVNQRFDVEFNYTFHYFDDIPRGPGGKFEDFICAIKDDPPPESSRT